MIRGKSEVRAFNDDGRLIKNSAGEAQPQIDHLQIETIESNDTGRKPTVPKEENDE